MRSIAALEDAIDQMKTNSKPVPVILVGGGHVLVSRSLRGVSEVHRPKHAEVANAVGAAIALVSGRVDKIYDFAALGRDARSNAGQAGSAQTRRSRPAPRRIRSKWWMSSSCR